MGHVQDPLFKVVYLLTYYSLTTQCNAAYVANGWCNVFKCYAAKIFFLYADQDKVMLLVGNLVDKQCNVPI